MRVPLGRSFANGGLASEGAPECHARSEVSQRDAEDISHCEDLQSNRRFGDPKAPFRSRLQSLTDTLLTSVRGSIGQLLIAQGAIDAGVLSDALARQSGRHPVASELYVLGYCTERQLAAALSVQTGWPAIVLDESQIRLDVLEHVSLRAHTDPGTHPEVFEPVERAAAGVHRVPGDQCRPPGRSCGGALGPPSEDLRVVGWSQRTGPVHPYADHGRADRQ